MKTENHQLKHIAAYLPYGLKCQYWGIINGKALSEQQKLLKKEIDNPDFNLISEEFGLKTGTLKEIKVFKRYWKAYIGNSGRALKSFYNGYEFKPVLKPLDDFDNSEAYKEINETYTLGYDKGLFNDAFTDGFEAKWLPIEAADILLKHHFDIFGLIDAGLAISINDLQP